MKAKLLKKLRKRFRWGYCKSNLRIINWTIYDIEKNKEVYVFQDAQYDFKDEAIRYMLQNIDLSKHYRKRAEILAERKKKREADQLRRKWLQPKPKVKHILS